MAKRRNLPARKPRDRSRDDDSMLLRSAESLGRVIGALQRQLDEATKRLANPRLTVKAAKGANARARKTSPAATATNKNKKARSRANGSPQTTTTRKRKVAKKR
jgi:hypothetical protein